MIKLWFGPMSVECVEAAHKFSALSMLPVGLCASEGQVGVQGSGYTGLAGPDMPDLMAALHRRYPVGHVEWQRDHLRENRLETTKKDIENGCYLTHAHTTDVGVCEELNAAFPDHLFEFGPGEGDEVSDHFLEIAGKLETCLFVSYPTGCLIDGLRNTGKIRPRRTSHLVKGHNCDYRPSLLGLRDVVDAVNVAPQFGVIQSCTYLLAARRNGTYLGEWEAACSDDMKRRRQWQPTSSQTTQALGHYHFDLLPASFRKRHRASVIDVLVAQMEWVRRSFLC